MSFPDDILISGNAKYFGFSDQKLQFNTNYDINWSFTYSLSGNEHGIATFLTHKESLSGYPGHYLGYSGSNHLSSYLTNEDDDILLTEGNDPDRVLLESGDAVEFNGIFCVAFDTTGLFALSGYNRPGVGLGSIKPNSLIIRDSNDELTFYETLSNINSDFSLSSNLSSYQTLRFRYSYGGKRFYIDYRNPDSSLEYSLLTSFSYDFKTINYENCYVGFSFCSPISSLETPSTFHLKNFHIQGNTEDTKTKYNQFIPLTSIRSNIYTTISTVTANPVS